MHVTALLGTYLRPHRRLLLLISVLLLVQAVGNLYLPRLNADIINDGVVTGDTATILRLGAVMLAISALLGVAAIVTVYASARTSMQVGRALRRDLFTRVEGLSLTQMHAFGVPSLITRTTNDVQQVQMLVMVGLTMMLLAPVMGIGGVLMAVRTQAELSLLLLVTVPLMLAVIGLMIGKAVPLFRSMQVKIDRVNQVLRESLTGVRVVRAFVRTTYEEGRFAEANTDLTVTSLRVNRRFALAFPALMLIMSLSSVAVIWFGGGLIDARAMPIGNLLAFQQYIMQILFSVMMATMTVMMVPRASAAADRIQAVLLADPEIADPVEPSTLAPTRGRIELNQVSFRYPGAEDLVLKDISLVLEPGQTTAIVGGTGSGKSTLANLLPRLIDVTSGAITIDGIDIRSLPLETLWSAYGIVPQRAFLFAGTVASNVRFGKPDAGEDEVRAALDTAQAGFVDELDGGLDALVEQGGANLSGGQRQRIAIARCLVRRPLVYLFDDSFSALDFSTESRLRSALARETAGSTVVVVAQRISTIMHADQIVVLEDGAVVGLGRHEELLVTCSTYREILASQVTAEELA